MLRKKSLKWYLFLLPALSILLVFITMFGVFNLAFEAYIQKESSKHIDAMFEKLDNYYRDTGYEGFYDENTEFIIQVYYAILDEDKQLLFPEQQWAESQEMERGRAAAASFAKHPQRADTKSGTKFKLGQESYYMKVRTYRGSYDSFFIGKEGDASYSVLVYINITPLQSFLDMANRILLILLPLAGLISILLIFVMAGRVDASFAKLNRYILRLGQKKEKNKPEKLSYAEFDELAHTVYKMAKEIERAEESQKQFFQNASHELKTPLASIQGYAEAIRSGVSRDVDKAMDIIVSASKKMSSLVDEILLLSKMDSRMDVMETEILDLKELLYSVSWYLKERMEQKKIALYHHFPKERILVYGDERKLERAFSNVLSNAVRYAKTEIGIACELRENAVCVCIRDDGAGIDAKDMAHIFERFYKGRGGNFGIGLALTKEIIDRHKGHIRVQSEPGCTEFWVELPGGEEK